MRKEYVDLNECDMDRERVQEENNMNKTARCHCISITNVDCL